MGRKKLIGPATEYIAGELRAQRARRGWTFDDLARLSDIPRSTVERAMKGDVAIAVEVLIALCAAMEIDINQLMTEAANL